MDYNSCSIFGHWEIEKKYLNIEKTVRDIFIDLIENRGVGYFYFGGFGAFDSLCHKIITDLKKKIRSFKKNICVRRLQICR